MEYSSLELSRTDRAELDRMFAQMEPRRQERCLQFRFPEDRDLCIAADGLLRRTIAGITGEDPSSFRFETDGNGKPHLPGDRLYFSVSHTAGLAVCAVSSLPVGIDAEALRPIEDRVRLRICSPSERLWSDRPEEDRQNKFFWLWTRKEALFKLRGTGLKENWRTDVLTPPEGILLETLRRGNVIISRADILPKE